MKRTTPVVAAAVLASALAMGSALATGTASGDPGHRADITWAPCPERADVECGQIRLPVDWADPGGEVFTLALARQRADDPAARQGVLFVNLGGPGGSGVDFALAADRYFSPDVLARFDVVGFDPRGVARSNPVVCSAAKLAQAPPTTPTDRAGFARLARHNRELADDCRANTGPLHDHVDTGSVVRDLDALRRSLGEREINYFGLSYSTMIGRQYAERYGHRIRAMVLDSNMDHSLGVGAFVETEAAAAEDSFREFVAWCDRTPSCALHGRDVVALWHDLLARAGRGELGAVTPEQVRREAFAAFYGPTWAALAGYLEALDAGHAPTTPVPTTSAPTAPELVPHPFPAVFCLDWHLPVRDHREFAALTERARRAAPTMQGSPLGADAVAACVGRAGDAVNPQRRLRVTGDPRILLLNARHDPATAHEWAVNANRQAGRATSLLTYDGWGHGVYDRSDCTRAATDAYLIDLVVPRDGTRCAAVEPTAEPAVARAGILPWATAPTT